MDLASLDTGSDAAVLHLRHPGTGKPLYASEPKKEGDTPSEPLTIKLVSMDSPRYRKAQRQVTDERLGRDRRSTITAEEIEKTATRVLVMTVVSWTNIVFDGKTLECTPDNVRLVFERLPWVREQCDEFISSRANFVKASATN